MDFPMLDDGDYLRDVHSIAMDPVWYNEQELHYVLWGSDPAEQNTSTTHWRPRDFLVHIHRRCFMAKLRGEIVIAVAEMKEYKAAKKRRADVVHAALTVERVLPQSAVLILVEYLKGP